MKWLLLPLISSLAAPLATRTQGIPAAAATPRGFAIAAFKLVPGGRATSNLNGDGRPATALVLAQAASRRGRPPVKPLVRLLDYPPAT